MFQLLSLSWSDSEKQLMHVKMLSLVRTQSVWALRRHSMHTSIIQLLTVLCPCDFTVTSLLAACSFDVFFIQPDSVVHLTPCNSAISHWKFVASDRKDGQLHLFFVYCWCFSLIFANHFAETTQFNGKKWLVSSSECVCSGSETFVCMKKKIKVYELAPLKSVRVNPAPSFWLRAAIFFFHHTLFTKSLV